MLEILPKSTELIVGWRTWKFLHPDYFSDLGFRQIWEPHKPHEARCEVHEVVPSDHQHCGIYAFKTKEEMFIQNYANAATHVWGEVYLWGRVVEHAAGYRAQYAYFKALWVQSPELVALIPWLEHKYGVSVYQKEDKDIPERNLNPYAQPYKYTAKAPLQQQLSVEKLWIFCNHPAVPLPERKMFRNMLRARLTQSVKKQSERMTNLAGEIVRVKKIQAEAQAKINHLDRLMVQWKVENPR